MVVRLAALALVACGRIGFGTASQDDAAGLPSDAHTALAGLIGCWTFDEGTGSTASDCSGNGSVGTLGGAATWTAGEVNGAVSLTAGARVAVSPASRFDLGRGRFSSRLLGVVQPAAVTGYTVWLWQGGPG